MTARRSNPTGGHPPTKLDSPEIVLQGARSFRWKCNSDVQVPAQRRKINLDAQ
jgi:hypothetical protein